ncbi:MAG: aminopeptidase P N-terminal domain-containing protein [Bacteroidales bacterium]|nr:aminopeptidase P N-terminal domain-containing protein [Bacteroidales bacterium]
MKYFPIANSFFTENRKSFSDKLKPNSVAIINSNDEQYRNGDQFYKFRQNSDFFYLTGINQEKSVLIIAPDCPNPNLREVLFIAKSNEKMETWYGHKYSIAEAKEVSGIKTIFWLVSFESMLSEIMGLSENVFLNLNEYPKLSTDTESRDLRFVIKIKNNYPLHNYHRAAPILWKQRIIKSKTEIELIKKSCEITENTFRQILKFIKPGIMEFEIEAKIAHDFLRNRANGSAYHSIIASGENACILHYTDNDKECKDGDMLLMDFGAEYANYAADLTRTIPVNGKFTERQKQVYEAVLRVQKKAVSLMTPGNTIEKLNKKVDETMETELIELNLCTKNDFRDKVNAKKARSKYYMHGVSHFIGLDVHDVGSKYETFKPGMILSCEPAIYIKEEKLGIRIENDILITENEAVDLMKNIPREVDEIEKLMAE